MLAVYIVLMMTMLSFGSIILYKKKYSNMLGYFCIAMALYQGLVVLDALDIYIAPRLYFLLLGICFLPGPLLLGYVGEIVEKKLIFYRDFLFVFLPSLLAIYVTNINSVDGFYGFSNRENYLEDNFVDIYNVVSTLAGAHIIFYVAQSITLIYEYRIQWYKIKTQPLPLSWYQMISTIAFFLLCAICQVISAFLHPVGAAISIGDIAAVVWMVYLNVVLILYIYKESIFNLKISKITFIRRHKDEHNATAEPPFTNTDNAQTDVNVEALDYILSEIKENKYFLLQDLTLHELSTRLKIKPYLLSEYLNKDNNSNFYSFINGLRIDEAKKLLKEKPHLSVSVVKDMCGFKSRASFYNNFKKNEGCTPLAYRKNNCLS